MKKIVGLVIIILVIVLGGSYLLLNRNAEEKEKMEKIILNINEQDFIVELENNSATEELVKKLEKGPIMIEAKDYGNFEKVGPLGFELPRSDERMTTEVGDIVLYEGNEISLFYNSNTWSYTKIGHIVNINKDELLKILGKDNVILEFKLFA